jgi:hypothetical protein
VKRVHQLLNVRPRPNEQPIGVGSSPQPRTQRSGARAAPNLATSSDELREEAGTKSRASTKGTRPLTALSRARRQPRDSRPDQDLAASPSYRAIRSSPMRPWPAAATSVKAIVGPDHCRQLNAAARRRRLRAAEARLFRSPRSGCRFAPFAAVSSSATTLLLVCLQPGAISLTVAFGKALESHLALLGAERGGLERFRLAVVCGAPMRWAGRARVLAWRSRPSRPGPARLARPRS